MENKDSLPPSDDKLSDSSLAKVLEPLVPILKRALFSGAEMLLVTEEGLRKTVSDFHLPKDAVNYLIKQSEKSKDEFLAIFQRELKRFLSRIDIAGLTNDVLDGIAVEINATITLRTQEGSDDLVAKVSSLKATPRKKPVKKTKTKTKTKTKIKAKMKRKK